MRALESKPDLSQRDLARELGVSLGKTHYCLRALIDKGYVKTVNFKKSNRKRRYLYYLTPQGISAKAQITRRFLDRKLREHETLMNEIEELQREIREETTVCRQQGSVAAQR